jgi:uncharacterized protein YuzE
VEPTSVQAPTISPRVTFEPEIGTAYISLAEPGDDLVATFVKLWPVDDQPAALSSLVLDFDAAGRMIGIKILKPADRVLRTGLLDHPATHASTPEEPVAWSRSSNPTRTTARRSMRSAAPPDHLSEAEAVAIWSMLARRGQGRPLPRDQDGREPHSADAIVILLWKCTSRTFARRRSCASAQPRCCARGQVLACRGRS